MFPVACFPKSNTQAGAPAFVGPLDTLIAQGATLRHASSVRRLLSSYSGAACKLRGNGAGALEDISFLTDGSLDLAAAAALAAASGGTQALWHTAYDQAELVNVAQTTDANQPLFGVDYETKGGMQGTGVARFMSVNLGTLPNPSFICFIVNIASVSGARTLLGTSSTGAAYCRMLNDLPAQAWGTAMTGTSQSTGKRLLGFLVNGASSQIYVNGALNASGDSGNTLLNMNNGTLGKSSFLTTTTWFNTVGNTMSEFIIFDGNPTALVGWTDFVTSQKSYFGVP